MKKLPLVIFVGFVGFAPISYADNNCTGATYYDADSGTCIDCPNGYDYNTESGKTSVSQCQIHCAGGTWMGGYTTLEYIEGTGTQYIDTNVAGFDTGNWQIYVKWMLTDTPAAYSVIAGTSAPTGYNAYYICTNNESPNSYLIWANGNMGGAGGYHITSLRNNRIHEVVLEDGHFTADGTNISITKQSKTISATNRFGLFAAGSNGGGTKFSGRIYASWAKKDGVYQFNLIPVRRDSDGAIGMYDGVSGTFVANSGTGDFVAGPVVGAKCVNVGSDYWTPESTINYGSVGIRNACPTDTHTVGWGHGADSANDCGYAFHVGNMVLRTRKDKVTNMAIHIRMQNGEIQYVNLTPDNHNLSSVHLVGPDGLQYTAYDDSLFYGERDFETGQQIVQ